MKKGRVFCGVRTADDCRVTFDGEDIDPCFWIRNHSPDGFNWGYMGSGPAQLSLAMIWRCTEQMDQTEDLYQRFKFEVIGLIEADEWEIGEIFVKAWINSKRSMPAK